MKRICFLVKLFFIISCIGNHSIAHAEEELEVGGTFAPESTSVQTINALRTDMVKALSRAHVLKLDSLSQEEADSIVTDDSLRRRIGIKRQINSLSSVENVEGSIDWQPLPSGGKIASFTFTSPSAAALRLAIEVTSLPPECELRFFSTDIDSVGTVHQVYGKQILELLEVNKAAEPDNSEASIYWSPTVEGETISLEIYLPEGIDISELQITFPALSHLAVSPFRSSEADFNLQSYGASNSCQNDATCYTNWRNMRRATAKMVYTKGGYSYICTGTLLNDKDPSTYKPYFISAAHCINSQTVASTLNTLWFYESASCNSSTRNSNYTIRYGGATLLWSRGLTTYRSSSSMDTSFFKLNESPPGGTYYSGWTTSVLNGGKTGVHHPKGDWKKISFGSPGGSYSCWSISSKSFQCSYDASGNFFLINWTDGGTEGGSSGSGLFQDNDHLMADLTGGSGSCGGSYSYYSTFNAAYYAGNLGRWLNVGPAAAATQPSLSPVYKILLSKNSSTPISRPVVSSPNPANGATVSARANGQLLRVRAVGATGGTIYYDDDSTIDYSVSATVNGDYLEAVIPYSSGIMNNNGTNAWYVNATNSAGTTRYPASGSLSFTVFASGSTPVVSNPFPADGATVTAGASGQLLRVRAVGATSGTVYYDDDSVVSFSVPATTNGDYLEAVIPYSSGRMNNNGVNYWYVNATNSTGTTRYPASGNLSFTVFQ